MFRVPLWLKGSASTMEQIYTRSYLDGLRDPAALLSIAERDPRVLEVVCDSSIEASEEQALEFIAHGYGYKVSLSKLSREFVEQHRDDLLPADYLEWSTQDRLFVMPTGASDITPWFLNGMDTELTREYAKRCSPEFLAEFEARLNVIDTVSVYAEFEDLLEHRESHPDAFTGYLACIWLARDGEMDEINLVIDWLVKLGEFRVLATCFWRGVTDYDPYIALATKAPEALKYLDLRSVDCDSNTVRDLFLMRGRGRELNVSMFEPDFAIKHWEDVGPLGEEWFELRWSEILLEATDLPKSPIPMFLLRELGDSIGSSERFNRHLDYVSAHCQGYDDYRALYERLRT